MVIAGIVAGGSGRRMGGDIPKQFYELNGKPVIIYTTEVFLKHEKTDRIIIGINPDWADYTKALIKKYFPDNDNIFITDGGADRNETIMNMISFAKNVLSCDDRDITLTHDAVRPFVSSDIISESIAVMDECEICTAAIPETDTVIESEDGKTALAFPDRSHHPAQWCQPGHREGCRPRVCFRAIPLPHCPYSLGGTGLLEPITADLRLSGPRHCHHG